MRHCSAALDAEDPMFGVLKLLAGTVAFLLMMLLTGERANTRCATGAQPSHSCQQRSLLLSAVARATGCRPRRARRTRLRAVARTPQRCACHQRNKSHT
jgi:hypothetical protein